MKSASPAPSLRHWRLRPGFGLALLPEGGDDGPGTRRPLVIERDGHRFPLGACSTTAGEALLALNEGIAEEAIGERAATAGGDALIVAEALYLFRLLRAGGYLMEVLHDEDGEFALCEPMTGGLSFADPPLPEAPIRLSRFAFLTTHEGEAVLESPLSYWRIRPRAAGARSLVTSLMGGCVSPARLEQEAERWLAGRLVACGMAGPVDAQGRLPEDTDPDLRFWDFHDLLHARRARTGGHDHPVGATFPGKGVVEPLPAVKPPMVDDAEDIIPLPRADIAAACRTDPPFQAVVEARRSIRAYGTRPIDRDRLGAFLFRSARLIERVPPDPENELFYEASRRPWPCGGAAYETEIYVTVNACEGLARGIYHYDPEHHRLERLSEDEDLVAALVGVAWHSAAHTVRPQVLLTLTARMRRLGWKYRGMAWAVAMKHAGVLYHAFYLAATALGLAPCGLGAGNTELVARAFGIDPVAEMPIGEFMLGSLPERS